MNLHSAIGWDTKGANRSKKAIIAGPIVSGVVTAAIFRLYSNSSNHASSNYCS